jgi:hypothetical protein
LSDEARAAWRTWMASWTAAMWSPHDLPGLRTTIALYDRMLSDPKPATATALLRWLDSYGLTPHGAQQLRWQRPVEDETTAPTKDSPASKYRHLKAVEG